MGAPELLHHLRAAGLVLTLTPAGGLHVAPRSALTDDRRATIRTGPAPGSVHQGRATKRRKPCVRVSSVPPKILRPATSRRLAAAVKRADAPLLQTAPADCPAFAGPVKNQTKE